MTPAFQAGTRKQCGYSITVIIPGFQPGDPGAAPGIRSKFFVVYET